jgi:hypothetical protein
MQNGQFKTHACCPGLLPAVQYCKEVPGKVDYRKYLSGWFLGEDFNSIKRENIEEFVAYGFCFKSR